VTSSERWRRGVGSQACARIAGGGMDGGAQVANGGGGLIRVRKTTTPRRTVMTDVTHALV
jgi:hypothetical protein